MRHRFSEVFVVQRETQQSLLVILGLIAGVAMLSACRKRSDEYTIPDTQPAAPLTMSFDGDSTQLTNTQIVPTLDTPTQKGRNVVWCASFVAAWKEFQKITATDPVLNKAENVCQLLNKAPDPNADIPANSFLATAGWEDQGILQTITTRMKELFPETPAPTFSGVLPGSLVMFAHLETQLRFTIPFFENREPLEFIDRTDKATRIRTFGIRPKDEYAFYDLRKQIRILYQAPDATTQRSADHKGIYLDSDYAVDLCRDSAPSQIVIARVNAQDSLAATLAWLDAKIEEQAGKNHDKIEFGPTDVLLVPDIYWHLTHHYSELEKKTLTYSALKGRDVYLAQQEILFRLDRSGMELKSEARAYYAPVPYYYITNRPFLLYVKKRGAAQPYFVMWVENAELLQKWDH